ncbi:hypothetical protein [Burkholderia multivorans]|uniref:hypothetical protein n=1 Tax=Burkholderia multivorans TaxID=87883 RepID=UPI0013DE8E40|nr:hypothetical protein [Burkholderia multivorans]NGM79703.1 hypothetical protein [Burkholderia multivorans]
MDQNNIVFLVIIVPLLGLLVYYWRRPSLVVAGAVEQGKRIISFAKGCFVVLAVLAVFGVLFFLLHSIVATLMAGGPIAALLAYVILRDLRDSK